MFSQGDEGEALYIICQGELEMRVGERAVAKVGAGECIGELALLDGEPRSASAIARADATLLKIAAGRFKHLLDDAAGRRARAAAHARQAHPRDAGEPDAAALARTTHAPLAADAGAEAGLQQLVSTMSFLRQVELFKDLPTAALANLAGIAQEVHGLRR